VVWYELTVSQLSIQKPVAECLLIDHFVQTVGKLPSAGKNGGDPEIEFA
jgi:hypothetical protein